MSGQGWTGPQRQITIGQMRRTLRCFCLWSCKCSHLSSKGLLHVWQVAERKHKPTVLEFMEPLIDQTVPGTVEEDYMVR